MMRRGEAPPRNARALRHETGEWSVILERAHRKTLDLRSDFAISEDDFIDLYGRDIVLRDKRQVEGIKADIRGKTPFRESDIERQSMVLEGIMVDQIEQSNWLGDDTFAQFASEYDDYVNGVDIVLERDTPEGNNVMGLAIDVTRGFQNMQKKMQRIQQQVARGTLSEIRYFKSEKNNFRGELRQVPRVIVGVSNATLEKLVRRWVDDANHELAIERTQLILLEEICMQLDSFRTLASRRGHTKAADVLDRQFRLMDRVRQSDVKKAIAEQTHFDPGTDNDQIFTELQRQLDTLY